jgi:hypothetical protein
MNRADLGGRSVFCCDVYFKGQYVLPELAASVDRPSCVERTTPRFSGDLSSTAEAYGRVSIEVDPISNFLG